MAGVVILELLYLFAGNEKLDAEVVATTTTRVRGTEDDGTEVNESKSAGPPARPQPPVCPFDVLCSSSYLTVLV